MLKLIKSSQKNFLEKLDIILQKRKLKNPKIDLKVKSIIQDIKKNSPNSLRRISLCQCTRFTHLSPWLGSIILAKVNATTVHQQRQNSTHTNEVRNSHVDTCVNQKICSNIHIKREMNIKYYFIKQIYWTNTIFHIVMLYGLYIN